MDAIATRSTEVVGDFVVPGLERICREVLGAVGWAVSVADDDPQAVLLTFPSPSATYTYGAPVVKAEFGARGDPWPTETRVVKPYLEEQYEGTAGEGIAEVTRLAAEGTFWEKMTLLHALHHGTLTKADKRVNRLSRHLYDIHQMWGQPDGRAHVVTDRRLLQAVVRNKVVFFREVKAKYELDEQLDLNSAPHKPLEKRLREDYAAMAAMFFPDAPVPRFDDLLATLQVVDAMVAGWGQS